MTYDGFIAIFYDENDLLICAVIVGAFIGFLFLFSYSFFEMRIKKPQTGYTFAGLSVIAMLLLIFGSNIISSESYKIDDMNRRTAENNLKKKYDIESVLWAESQASADSSSGSHYIKVQDKNSNILKFRYKVNKETNEPSLLNEENNTGRVTVNDLLLKR